MKPAATLFADDEYRIFDTGERDHVIGLIAASKNDPQKYRDDLADALERLLIAPLDRVLALLCERVVTADDTRAFRNSAEIVVSLLRLGSDDCCGDELLARWNAFIAENAAYRIYHDIPATRNQARKNRAGKVKKTVSREELESFRLKFLGLRVRDYGITSDRGWKKCARLEFSIDAKTLTKIWQRK